MLAVIKSTSQEVDQALQDLDSSIVLKSLGIVKDQLNELEALQQATLSSVKVRTYLGTLPLQGPTRDYYLKCRGPQPPLYQVSIYLLASRIATKLIYCSSSLLLLTRNLIRKQCFEAKLNVSRAPGNKFFVPFRSGPRIPRESPSSGSTAWPELARLAWSLRWLTH